MTNKFNIEVYLDTICPWCYIGKKNLDRAIDAYKSQHPDAEFEFIWKPFLLYPDSQVSGTLANPQDRPPPTSTVSQTVTPSLPSPPRVALVRALKSMDEVGLGVVVLSSPPPLAGQEIAASLTSRRPWSAVEQGKGAKPRTYRINQAF
jgi:hypothetical protein